MEPFTIFDYEKKIKKIENINEFINTKNCFFKDNDIGLIKLGNIYFTRFNAYDYNKKFNFSFAGYSRINKTHTRNIYSKEKSELKIKKFYSENLYYFDFCMENYLHAFIDTFPYIYINIYIYKNIFQI